jgi:TolB-like protein
LAAELKTLPNSLLIEGHTDATPYSGDTSYSNWDLSADRANSARRLLQQDGVRSDQVTQVRGYADQMLRVKGGRILLVLPFDNRTGQPSLEWIREAAPEILGSRFASAGFAPMSRADRLYALDHLGLPQGFHPSRASSLKLAQTLDADSIVVGSYVTDGTGIVAEAQLVDVPHLRMSLR